jgi:hypothetical protein
MLQTLHRVGKPSLLGQSHAQIVMDRGGVGPCHERLLKATDGLGGLSVFSEGDAQLREGIGMAGLQPQGLAEVVDGLGSLSLAGQAQGQLPMDLARLRRR